MIEFLIGLAIGALLMGAWAYAMWQEDPSVPEPTAVPRGGERWTLRDRDGDDELPAVTVREVCAGSVFYAYEGLGTRGLTLSDFVRLYRRA